MKSTPDNATIEKLVERVAKLEAQVLLLEQHHIRGFWFTQDRIDSFSLATRRFKCIVCDYEDERDGFEILQSECMFNGGKLERYKCPNCDCVFGAQKFLDLDETMIGLDYQLLYSRYRENETAHLEDRTFRSLQPIRGGVYINWGAGAWNDTTVRLREEGFDVWSYEPSAPSTAKFVAKTVGEISVKLAGIFSNNVIEHFPNPIEQFRQFHGLLLDGGRMAHSSPCYEYAYPFTRFHTVFLLGRSPEVLAERTGFRITDRVQDGSYINLVYEKI